MKGSLAATLKLPLTRDQQRRLIEVAADEGSLIATLELPLMRRDKIKIKNKRLISSDKKVAANKGSTAATLGCHH
jgi:hypothetical protein